MRDTACDELDCASTIEPVHLFISVKGYPSAHIVFTEAEDTRQTIRMDSVQTIHDISERPILLRGVGSRRSPTSDRERIEFPITGTLYQDNGELQLEVALSNMNRYDPDRLIVARIFLDASAKGTVARGRAVHPSSHAFTDTSCGNHEPNHPLALHSHSVRPSQITQLETPKVLYLGTHFDRQFMRAAKCKTASQCNNRILGIINQASLPYRRQLNVRLRVGLQYGPAILTSGTTESGTMLDNYHSFIEAFHSDNLHDGTNNGGNLVDGFTGFTGQKMRNNVAGIAAIETFCNNTRSLNASILVRHTSKVINPSVVAHELGHTLGAYHSYGGIMAPKVSTKSAKKLRFASGSISEISSHLNGWYSECREGTNFTAPPGFGSTIQLAVSRSQDYTVSIQLELTKPRANCSVLVKAAETAADTASWTTIFRHLMEGTGLSLQMTTRSSIDATLESDATVYFKALYVCQGEQIVAESSVIPYVPNYGPSSYSMVSRNEWITQLQSLLN